MSLKVLAAACNLGMLGLAVLGFAICGELSFLMISQNPAEESFDVLGSIRNGEGTTLFWAYMVSCRRMRNSYHEGLSLDSFLRSEAN